MRPPEVLDEDGVVIETLQIGVLLFDGVEPLDAIGPAQVFWSLQSARRFVPDVGAVEVHMVAERDEPVATRGGFFVLPTVTYDDCPHLDVLIVPGGTGEEDRAHPETATSGRLFQSRHEATLAFVRDASATAVITASVCTGAFILGGAGLLAGRRVNTHWASRDELVEFMAARGESITIVAERVVDDGDLVSGGGVSSGIDVALHLVGRLLGAAALEAAAAVIERETPPEAAKVRRSGTTA